MSETPEQDRGRIELVIGRTPPNQSPADLPKLPVDDLVLKAIADGHLPRVTWVVGESREARMRRLNGDDVYIAYIHRENEFSKKIINQAAKGIKGLQDALAAAESSIEQRRREGRKVPLVVQAIAIMLRNPSLSNVEIAKQVGCTPSNLSGSAEYRKFANIARQVLRQTSSRGVRHEARDLIS